MKNHEWTEAVAKVLPFVVKIETPDSYGSGFLIVYQPQGKHTGVAIATAAHVVKHASDWREMIRLTSNHGQVILKPDYYEVVNFEDQDLALLEFLNDGLLAFPSICLPWCNKNEVLPAGSPVGWCGFPNIADNYCCFFGGMISAACAGSGDYLVDGVVINGVSGGPAFVLRGNEPHLIGLVSAYFPNEATGKPSPGLGFIASISPMLHFFAKENKVIAETKRTAMARRTAASMKRKSSKSKEYSGIGSDIVNK